MCTCYNTHDISIENPNPLVVKPQLHVTEPTLLVICRNPSFGLATKAKGLQGCEPRISPEVTSHTSESVKKCEGVNPHTPKATPTLGDGILMDSRNFREQFEGQNSKACGVLYIIGKLLERYGAPKWREFRLARFRDSHAGVLGKKSYLDVGVMA